MTAESHQSQSDEAQEKLESARSSLRSLAQEMADALRDMEGAESPPPASLDIHLDSFRRELADLTAVVFDLASSCSIDHPVGEVTSLVEVANLLDAVQDVVRAREEAARLPLRNALLDVSRLAQRGGPEHASLGEVRGLAIDAVAALVYGGEPVSRQDALFAIGQLVREIDTLEDEEADLLRLQVEAAFGSQLATIALRGRLFIREDDQRPHEHQPAVDRSRESGHVDAAPPPQAENAVTAPSSPVTATASPPVRGDAKTAAARAAVPPEATPAGAPSAGTEDPVDHVDIDSSMEGNDAALVPLSPPASVGRAPRTGGSTIDERRSSPQPVGVLERWARFSHRHHSRVIAAWVLFLGAILAANFFFGGTFVSEIRVPGSEAQQAADLLKARFPARAGDNADLVFEAPGGISSDAARARIQGVIADVAKVPGVVSVDSPYDQARFIAKDGTIARAEVHWSTRASSISSKNLHAFLKIVDNASGDGVRVEAGGRVVAQNESPQFGSEMLGLLAAVVILLIAFGSVTAMGLPLGAAAFGLGAGFAAMGLGTNLINFPSYSPSFAAMIGLGVGIDYSLLIVTRFREGLHSGKDVEESIVLTLTTSGRAVIFAGMIVAVAFLGLFMMGLPFVAALGTAGALIVVFAVLVATTLMPAALSLAGRSVDRWRLPFLHSTEGVDANSSWYRFSAGIQRHPLPYFAAAVGLLLLLAAPALSMRLGFIDAGNNPKDHHSRRAYDLLAQGFGPGFNGALTLVADVSNGGDDRFAGIAAAVRSTDNVAEVSPVIRNPAGDTALITVFARTKPQDEATKDLVHYLREQFVPARMAGTHARVYVTGGLAGSIDAQDRIGSRMPLLFAGVIGLSLVLLTVVFRSVVVAVKAAIMNLLSIGASYGVLVAIFQWGWFSHWIGIEKGPIETFLPMMMFAILFGLSMDYEVFLISRVREEYVRTGDNTGAVSHGLAATARVITAAAAIMVAVFATFVFGNDRTIKEIGAGLATAIFVDATIVRLVLVPSTMELLGNRNWWQPSWLDHLIPGISVDRGPEPVLAAPDFP